MYGIIDWIFRTIYDNNFVRYSSQKKAPKKPSVSEVQSKPAMLVSDERFFHVDSTLADAFKETETKVFTLTSMFDDDDDVVPQTETQTVLHTGKLSVSLRC